MEFGGKGLEESLFVMGQTFTVPITPRPPPPPSFTQRPLVKRAVLSWNPVHWCLLTDYPAGDLLLNAVLE